MTDVGIIAARLADPYRLASLRATGLLNSTASAVLDRLTRAASKLLDAPIALVSLVDDHRQYFAGACGLPEPTATRRRAPLAHSVCKHVVATSEPLIVSDAQRHPIFASHPTFLALNARSYVGVPLVLSGGETLGAMCVYDTRVRDWRPTDVEQLSDLASAAVSELELRIALNERRSGERRFRAFMDHSPVVAALADDNGRLAYVNAMFEWHFGVEPTAVIGLQLDEINNPLAQRMAERHDAVLLSGEAIERAETMSSPNGGDRQWLLYTFPFTEGDGRMSVGTVALDLTERHHLEQQLRQAQKLEAIGQLAAGIAHEINTPTQYVSDNLRFLKESFEDVRWLLRSERPQCSPMPVAGCPWQSAIDARLPLDHVTYLADEVPRAIDQSIDGLDRIAQIVHSIKAFSHPGGKEATLVDLNASLRSTIEVSRAEWKYVASAELDLEPTLPLVRCFPNELHQVFLNLVVNAAHAMRDNGKQNVLRLTTRCDGEFVRIRVSDTGTGIPEEIRSRVFDPFFTTKPVGTGTGQGLAISHAVVVEKHAGTITFESVEGEGTTFEIRLPIAGVPETRAPIRPPRQGAAA